MVVNEKAVESSKKDAKRYLGAGVLGVVFGSFFALFLPPIIGSIFIGCGICLLIFWKRNLRMDEMFHKYKEIIGEREVISISELASHTEEEKKIVVENLEWMMQKKFFENVQIDSGNEFFRSRDYFKKQAEKEASEAINDVNQIFEEFEDNFQEIQNDVENLMKEFEGDMSNFKIHTDQDGQKIVMQWSSFLNSNGEEGNEFYSEVCDCCGGATKIRVGGGGVCDYCGAPIGKYKKYDNREDD